MGPLWQQAFFDNLAFFGKRFLVGFGVGVMTSSVIY
jgi:hypothetical protein